MYKYVYIYVHIYVYVYMYMYVYVYIYIFLLCRSCQKRPVYITRSRGSAAQRDTYMKRDIIYEMRHENRHTNM